MNTQDFRFIQQGKQISPLLPAQVSMLAPVDVRGQGRDRALLLLHGFSSSPAVFRVMMLDAFTKYDAVVCPVLPGHSESIAAFSTATARDWMATAEAACSALLQEYKVVDVLGFSLGGLLACHLSQRFTLNRLYLLAPALVMKRSVSATLFCARALHFLGFKWLHNRGGNLYTNHYAELTYRQLPIATIIEILTFIKDYSFVPPKCPTDLFLGRYDEVVDSPSVAGLFVDTPNVTTHWLESSAHVLPLDGDIVAIVACIKSHQRL